MRTFASNGAGIIAHRGKGTDLMDVIHLKRDEDRRVKRGHPWIYSNEIDVARSPLKGAEPGAEVRVEDARGVTIGVAHLSPASLVAARLLTRAGALEPDYLEARISRALAFRERCFPTPHYRWVYAEGDGLPGLVIDRYGDGVVIQTSTWGMERQIDAIVAAIDRAIAPRSIVIKNDGGSRIPEGLPAYVEVRRGSATAMVVEAGAEFATDLAAGQKTGWFYDQRDNRGRFAALYRGADVLDLYAYVGAWSVHAARRGARRVLAVDASESAVVAARQNAERNGVAGGVEVTRGDAAEYLDRTTDRFDVVILDPPALVRRRKDLKAGRALYRHLNARALAATRPGGLLVSCSCSSALDADTHLADLRAAARQVHRDIALVGRGGLPADHPIHPWLPETDYLKCAFVRAG
jgi:23S rRNA (cytosine1962-C5)-methyltransferase